MGKSKPILIVPEELVYGNVDPDVTHLIIEEAYDEICRTNTICFRIIRFIRKGDTIKAIPGRNRLVSKEEVFKSYELRTQ